MASENPVNAKFSDVTLACGDVSQLTQKQLFDVRGKHALVTGGSSGISLFVAATLVANGANVCIASRSLKVCQRVASQLDCDYVAVDLTDDEACTRIVDYLCTELHWPCLDILVNNSGTTWAAPLEEYPAEAFRKVLELNVTAVFRLTVACVPMLRMASAPCILNVGSVDGTRITEHEHYAYSASKAAVHQMTRILANRLTKGDHTPIRVNAILPGPFPSRMMRATLEQAGDIIEQSLPLRRVGQGKSNPAVEIEY
ncbi:MAG: hypothetical protein MHM6MM_000478 [Cercozoa sp. M6MM]